MLSPCRGPAGSRGFRSHWSGQCGPIAGCVVQMVTEDGDCLQDARSQEGIERGLVLNMRMSVQNGCLSTSELVFYIIAAFPIARRGGRSFSRWL